MTLSIYAGRILGAGSHGHRRRRIASRWSQQQRRCSVSAGFRGVSLADLMAPIGLTHGGFYRQFESKQALIAEATVKAFGDLSIPVTTPPRGRL